MGNPNMKNNFIHIFEQRQMKNNIPPISVGNNVNVNIWVKEGAKTRTQSFQGLVIKMKNRGFNSSFVVRKTSYGEGVEKTFQMHSPNIESISIEKHFRVRKAKLYHMRSLSGKSARLKEKFPKHSAKK